MTGWTDVIGWTLVHFVWQGTLIGVATAVVLHALRHASAQLRYVAACIGLCLSLAAPAITAATLAAPNVVLPVTPATRVVAPVRASVNTGATGQVVHTYVTGLVSSRSVPVDSDLLDRLLTGCVVAWLAGVLLLTVRLAVGWWRVRRLHVEALAAPASPWLSVARRIAARLHLDRSIHVVDSHRVNTPTVIGWLRPVVLLPIAALANLTPAQVQAILAHELAHVRRHDFVVNLLQTIAETLLFYHPVVWWLSGRIRVEREHCCDDVAVEMCGDPVGYAEALTALAAFATVASPLAVAATGGSLLHRVKRLLRLPADAERRKARTPFVLAATALLVVIVGMRLMVVAQSPDALDDAVHDRPMGPADVNRMLGFDLLPGPVRYATDDPAGARAWSAEVAYPGGEMDFRGFTARGLVRYGFGLDAMPVVDGPSWLDTTSMSLHAKTSAVAPGDADFREAIRVALEGEYGVSVRRETRLVPAYGLQRSESGRLGPNIRPSTVECFDSQRDRLETVGPTLRARGQQMLFCGVDHTFRGPRGYRVTVAQFARALRGFNLDPLESGVPARELVDQTGLSGVYDLELNLGFLPFAAIATAHPNLGITFGPLIRTFPQAIEEQLGLRLVPMEAPRDVAVLAAR